MVLFFGITEDVFSVSKFLLDFVLASDWLVLEVSVQILFARDSYIKTEGVDCFHWDWIKCFDFNRNCLLHCIIFFYLRKNCIICFFLRKNMEHIELVQKILVVLFTVAFFWKLITYMWSFLNVEKDPVIVLVTGAAGRLKSFLLFFALSFKLKSVQVSFSYDVFQCIK